MYYQQNRDRLKNIGNKSLQLSQYSDTRPFSGELLQQPQVKKQERKEKMKTEYSKGTPDSLQLFQDELNSVLSGTRIKKTTKKTKEPTYIISHPSKQTIEIKNEVNQIKTMLQSQRQIKDMQGKLQRLLLELEEQKMKPNLQTQRTLSNPPVNYVNIPPSPFYVPPPQMMYPPQPPPYYYPPPYHPYQHTRYKPRRRGSDEDISDDNDLNYQRNRKKPRNIKSRQTTPLSRTQTKIKNIKTRLRIIIFVVVYTIFIRSQAKKLSAVRKSNLKKFWVEKFESQINNIKNWFLDAQKFSLSIILEKKSLNFKFFDEKSQRVKEEKQKLILQIVNIGINKLLQDSTPQKISLFSELVLNLCRRGSFAINRFWTAQQMQQICISEYYGFFRIDPDLQKFLVGLLVFVKVFIFNMFLQPSKFDSKNFPKKQQPITTNMKIISSVYYHMVKQVINDYKNQNRDSSIYKVGNWLKVKNQFIVECSQPVIYGNGYPEDDQYISGLFKEDQIGELKDHEAWGNCVTKIKTIIEKIHSQMISKGNMVRKNLKYKLYN